MFPGWACSSAHTGAVAFALGSLVRWVFLSDPSTVRWLRGLTLSLQADVAVTNVPSDALMGAGHRLATSMPTMLRHTCVNLLNSRLTPRPFGSLNRCLLERPPCGFLSPL